MLGLFVLGIAKFLATVREVDSNRLDDVTKDVRKRYDYRVREITYQTCKTSTHTAEFTKAFSRNAG